MRIITSDECKKFVCCPGPSQSKTVQSKLEMSVNRDFICDSMKMCIQTGHQYKLTNPDRAMQEIEKLEILHEVLQSVTNFENQLVSDLDVD